MNWLMPSGLRLLNMSASCKWREGGREGGRGRGRGREKGGEGDRGREGGREDKWRREKEDED